MGNHVPQRGFHALWCLWNLGNGPSMDFTASDKHWLEGCHEVWSLTSIPMAGHLQLDPNQLALPTFHIRLSIRILQKVVLQNKHSKSISAWAVSKEGGFDTDTPPLTPSRSPQPQSSTSIPSLLPRTQCPLSCILSTSFNIPYVYALYCIYVHVHKYTPVFDLLGGGVGGGWGGGKLLLQTLKLPPNFLPIAI